MRAYIEILARCKRECGTSSRYTGIIIMALIKRALIKSVRRRESAINNGPICSRYPTTRGLATQFTPLAFTMTTRWIRINVTKNLLCYFVSKMFFTCGSVSWSMVTSTQNRLSQTFDNNGIWLNVKIFFVQFLDYKCNLTYERNYLMRVHSRQPCVSIC